MSSLTNACIQDDNQVVLQLKTVPESLYTHALPASVSLFHNLTRT